MACLTTTLHRCHVDLETLQHDKSFMATLQHLLLSELGPPSAVARFCLACASLL